MRKLVFASVLAFAACGGGSSSSSPDAGPGNGDDPSERPAATPDENRDLLSTDLVIDLSARTGVATIEVAAATSNGLSLEAGGLTIDRVFDEFGDLNFELANGVLEIGLPSAGANNTVTVEYQYAVGASFEGAFNDGDLTVIWPYYCGNLFPCKSDPDDGLRFTLDITGVANGQTAVFPASIPADAPSYMLGWAVGPYSYELLGTTAAGTEVGFYHLPGELPTAQAGTSNLLAIFDWFETELGPYTFGDKVASVSAEWGPGGFGGMEHHPLWHLADGAMGNEETHAHEAAHGWYGNGVRIACWEDFVLSEGTVTYLAARSIEVIAGAAAANDVWNGNRLALNQVADRIAWPEGCNEIDILVDGLFTSAPYQKGAFFYRSLAARIGAEVLDSVLATFYDDHVGGAARMQDMLDHIQAQTGYDATACATAWLRSTTIPDQEVCPEN